MGQPLYKKEKTLQPLKVDGIQGTQIFVILLYENLLITGYKQFYLYHMEKRDLNHHTMRLPTRQTTGVLAVCYCDA
jgi:hypothetical protein